MCSWLQNAEERDICRDVQSCLSSGSGAEDEQRELHWPETRKIFTQTPIIQDLGFFHIRVNQTTLYLCSFFYVKINPSDWDCFFLCDHVCPETHTHTFLRYFLARNWESQVQPGGSENTMPCKDSWVGGAEHHNQFWIFSLEESSRFQSTKAGISAMI